MKVLGDMKKIIRQVPFKRVLKVTVFVWVPLTVLAGILAMSFPERGQFYLINGEPIDSWDDWPYAVLGTIVFPILFMPFTYLMLFGFSELRRQVVEMFKGTQ